MLNPCRYGGMAEEKTEATPDVIPSAPEVPEAAATPSEPKTPDAIQPFIDTAYEATQHQVESTELDKFLRAHIKTFREEWENWSNGAKSVYTHMMTAQLLQRKAAAIQIGLGHEFKLPQPSAQTDLMASLQRTQAKPAKRYPAIDLPRTLRRSIS
ncbi:hypothetical protein [Limnohabitans sp.]|uniref:hypothetical protein n=2 Tax=Limnohabitans sp. TaxID=1907725 RepID=UPI00286F98D6|nr:hypothetical protein [Limnohabitans sp.]